MAWSPAVTVAALVRRQDRFLMVEERPAGHPVINQPAGHLERDESLIEAVVREVLEETARHFTPRSLVGVYQWQLPDGSHSYLRFCFAGEVGEPIAGRQLDPAITATHWLTAEEIRNGPWPVRSPMVLQCLDDALRGCAIGLEHLHDLE
jgi:8-oxo-dGTP pyrophosphatase MutT (NUDIX family)